MSELEEKIQNAKIIHFVFIGVLLAAVYYFNYFDGGESLSLQIDKKQAELQTLQKDLNDIESLTANYEKYQEDLNQLSEKFEVALDYLPSRENVYVIIKQLYNVAKTSGINITLVRPGEENVRKDFYEEMPITIEAEGGYIQLMTFLSKVVNLPRIINLVDVEIEAKDNSGSPVLKMSGKMVAYRYMEEQKEDNP